MDIVSLIYRGVYDALATVDVSGGVLLVAIWLQTGYVALFRAIHGEDAGRAPVRAVKRRTPVPPGSPRSRPLSPWGAR